MAAFHFELVSPARLLFSGSVEAVGVPGAEGDMTVMAGHAALMAALRPGLVTITEGAQTRRLFVRGGFADVNASGLTILAEMATPVEDLNPELIAKEIADGEAEVRAARSDEARQLAEAKLSLVRDVMANLRN